MFIDPGSVSSNWHWQHVTHFGVVINILSILGMQLLECCYVVKGKICTFTDDNSQTWNKYIISGRQQQNLSQTVVESSVHRR